MRYCLSCYKEYEDTKSYCQSCGTGLTDVDLTETIQAEKLKTVNLQAEKPQTETVKAIRGATPHAGSAPAGYMPANNAPADNASAGKASAYKVPAPYKETVSQKIESHLVKAIISTFCCCPPFGVLAIIYSLQTRSELKANDHEAALEASRKANIWSNLAIGIGVLWYAVYCITLAKNLVDGTYGGYFNG